MVKVVQPPPQWEDKGTYKEPIDSDNIRVPRLEVDDATTFIDKDGSDNMTFEDAVTGSKTLAQLSAAGGGDVVGPASSTDAVIALFDSTTGKLLKVAPITLTNDGTKTTIMGTSGDYNRVGDAGVTSRSLNSEDDWMVTGDLEVDGTFGADAQYTYFGHSSAEIRLGGQNLHNLWLRAASADANAHCIEANFDTTTNDVPVIVFAKSAPGATDWGLFDSLTQPVIAVLEHAKQLHSATDGIADAGAASAILKHIGGFTAAVVGDIVRITAGTLCTAGWYWITTVTSADQVTLDRNYTSGDTTNVTFVTYHDFTMLSADGVCTRITDGAPTDSSVEIDRDGWIIIDVGNDDLYYRSGSVWKSIKTTKLDDFATPDDNTDLDFSTSVHGLVPKGTNTGTDFLCDDGTWTTPAGGGDVTGPASSTNNEIARQHSTSGKVLQTYTSNPPTISDTGDMNIDGDLDVENIVVSGTVDGVDVSAHKDRHDPNDGADPLDTANASEIVGVQAAGTGTSHSLARADHAHQIQASIADNHIVTIDHATPVDNDYAKFTANGLEGRSYAEVLADLFSVPMPENSNIEWDNALSADGKWSGIVTKQFNGGATIPFGEVVYLKAADSEWYQAKADVTATSGAVMVGIVVLATTDGNACTVLLQGKVRADAKFPTFTISAPVFISAATAGLLTSTAPTGTTNFVVRIIGHAGTGDELYVHPDNSYVELA